MKINDQAMFSKELGEGWIRTPISSSRNVKNQSISKFRKFLLLMWKNWLLQRRRKTQTALEIFFSVIFCILLVIIRDLAPSVTYTEPTTFKAFNVSTLPSSLKPSRDEDFLSSIYSYLVSSPNDLKRRKREIDGGGGPDLFTDASSDYTIQYPNTTEAQMLRSMFAKDRALQMPKIKHFLEANSDARSLVETLLENTLQWALKKQKMYEKRARKHKTKRKKRFIGAIWDWIVKEPAWPIAYAPNNTAVKKLMEYVGEYLYLDTEGYGFATEAEMVAQLSSFSFDPERKDNTFFGLEDVLGGIVFTNEFVNNDTFPAHVKYKIRLKGSPRSGKKRLSFAPPPMWNTELTYPLFQIPGPREKTKNEGGAPGYFDEGFLAIQFALDRSFADYFNGTQIDSWAAVEMQRMPYPPYIDDTYLVALQAWLPLILLLSYLYPAVNIVKNVVYEKEKKLKESMKMMGLDNWLHWLAWFTKSMMLITMTTLLITLLLCTRWNGKGSLAVLDNSDPSLVFFFLFVYSFVTISFCFFMSTLFSKANSAATAVGTIWIFSYLPNIFLRPRFLSLSTRLKIGLCFYFNTGMSLGCFLASMFEGTGSGLQWDLIASGVSPDSPFCIADVIGMMVFDAVVYAVLTWYIEAVWPGEFGVPQPWNFPFKRVYWFGYSTADIPAGDAAPSVDGAYFEEEPGGLHPGIKVKGLTKVFRGRKTASVSNMYLNMYSNQVTVLLGHNGAGKTTTMSMLTGLFPPTRGTAEVNGFDIVHNMTQVRNSIGICPQHDVLFDDLTVTEHIKFFAQLKGLKTKKIAEEVSHILSGIELLDKANAQAKTLSGGMKRKLSVGIALCGKSRVVILDEPTTGMDPGARRVIWDLLQQERNGRTMLLTTHFMEEADLLGDRIAIMADGVVQCCGSSLFLKKTYGAGYHLTIVKERGCDVGAVTALIKSRVADAVAETNIAAELTFVLPAEDVAKFEALFSELEERKKELKISSYGASQTTMEEVFLRVGESTNSEVRNFLAKSLLPEAKKEEEKEEEEKEKEKEEEEGEEEGGGENGVEGSRFLPGSPNSFDLEGPTAVRILHPKRSQLELFLRPLRRLFFFLNFAKEPSPSSASTRILPLSSSPSSTSPQHRIKSSRRNSGIKLILQQCKAMLIKKALFTVRNWLISMVQLLIPIMFLLIAMLTLRNFPGVNDTPPELVSSPEIYSGTATPVQGLGNSSLVSSYLKYYSDQLEGQDHVIPLDQSVDMTSYLLNKTLEDIPGFNLHWMLGMKASQIERENSLLVLSLFNNQPYHVPPMALHLVDQALVRAATRQPDFRITTSNHPLPRTDTEKLTQESRQNIGFNIGFNLAFGMSFLSASFILFVIKERSSNCKHLQFVSGVNFFIFWFATAVWDFLCFMVTCLLVLLCLFLYNEKGLSEGPQLARIFLILVLYVWSILPFMYIASFFFSVPSSGFTRMSMIHTFTGMATLITVTILRIPDLELSHVADILDWFFLIFPPYAMASAIGDLYSNVRFTKICSSNIMEFLCGLGTFKNPCCVGISSDPDSCGPFGCLHWTPSLLGWSKLGIGRMLFFMAVEGFLFYAVIFMIEMRVHRSVKYILTSLYRKLVCKRDVDTESASAEDEDGDVKAERHRIQNAQLEDLFTTDKLILSDLSKKYNRGVMAVDRLNLGVPLGECFGLLGINGAGKTTTFKMLTGELNISHGDAYVNGYSVKSNIKKVQQEVGYCPQFDALLDQMTGRETLRMFARLRGVAENEIDGCISRIADQLLVTEHLDKEVRHLSGGNKRKISTGIALIGDPPLVLLDEPTSGMDPVARRHLWSVLNSVRDTGRSIILTSHSMEECEALCTRLAIMTNGSFRCIGSPQHLKSKFSEGYSIILRVSITESATDVCENEDVELSHMPKEMSQVQQFILTTFKESYLREMQWGRLEYFIPVEAASWAQVFGILERKKEELSIQDYSVTQTTLERVFLNFTRTQRPERN